jgi:hypothetical protein
MIRILSILLSTHVGWYSEMLQDLYDFLSLRNSTKKQKPYKQQTFIVTTLLREHLLYR